MLQMQDTCLPQPVIYTKLGERSQSVACAVFRKTTRVCSSITVPGC